MLDQNFNKFEKVLPNEYRLCFSGQNKREWSMLIDYEELTHAQSYWNSIIKINSI